MTSSPVTPSFPLPRRCPFGPPPEYEELRKQAPLVRVRFPSGYAVWVVTRHAEARQVLNDQRISTNPATPGHPMAALAGSRDEETPEERDRLDRLHEGEFIDLDPPEHDTYRRMLISEFSVRRVGEMRPGIQRIVDRLIDDMLEAGPPADLVEAFGLPVPSLVICQLLGVPYSDREFFQARTKQMITNMFTAASRSARDEIQSYLDGLVGEAEQRPGDDLIGRLVTGRRSTGELSHDALVGMAFLLLVAGHETTANMIPLGVLTLLHNPGALNELRAEPALWPSAVEELLRYHSIVDWAAFDRVAIEDIELGGQAVRAGDGIFVLGASANRDERAFERPDVFDIHRGARHHVAFGYGVHQCLGQNLARAELEIAYRALFERIPTLRLDGESDEASLKSESPIFGLWRLPVTW